MKSVKPRMLEQDIAKGIAIILVMALHTLTISKGIYNILGGLFGFIMPFYFFMAGYNHRPYRYTYKEIIRKRIKQIGVPFFTYSISITLISGAYYMIAEGYTFKMVLNSYLTLILTRPFAVSVGIRQMSGPYTCIMAGWFIIMLFMASLIFYAVVDFALSKPARFVSVFTGLLIVTMIFAHFDIVLPLHVCEAPAVAAIMLTGAMFGQNKLLAPNIKRWMIVINSLVAYALFVTLALMFRGSGFISGGNMWDKTLKEWAVVLSAVFVIVGTYPFVHFCRCLVKTGFVGKALAWCGNYSMKLLFIHEIVQLFICAILKIEPFRMAVFSDENDFRTFYVLALEIAGSVLVILAIDFFKKRIMRKNAAARAR
ncbi:MAG: acyltransferase family protein [Clostridia bacterium]|nr:acyltransferase family protein [Clostridia bacterium]